MVRTDGHFRSMSIDANMAFAIRNACEKSAGEPLRDAEIECKKLRGGSEACEVAHVTVRYRRAGGRAGSVRLFMKRLRGRPAREASIYEELVSKYAEHFSPRLVAVHRPESETAVLFLEVERKTEAWPWGDLSKTGEVLCCLAELHLSTSSADHLAIPYWDYEADVLHCAEETAKLLARCRRDPELSELARHVPAVDRLGAAYPSLRRQLLSEKPFGCRLVHGDVHPGNVLVSRRRGNPAILLDWGRARLGSPLEDVSSWLQTLRYWEPQAQRRHDTLLTDYIFRLGVAGRLNQEIRTAYWIAGASNALGGALLHHLRALTDQSRSKSKRAAAYHAARDWIRIIRRADAWTSS